MNTLRFSSIVTAIFSALILLSSGSAALAQNDADAIPLDHFKCYKVRGQAVRESVDLKDQFETEQGLVLKPYLLCAPVNKRGEGFANPDGENGPHLVCYKTRPGRGQPRFERQTVEVRNQFGTQELKVLRRANTLCVPSEKKVDGQGGGCTTNDECATNYCRKAVGDCGGFGICEPRPEICTQEVDPVCGCDGQTYSNACIAAQVGENVTALGQCQ